MAAASSSSTSSGTSSSPSSSPHLNRGIMSSPFTVLQGRPEHAFAHIHPQPPQVSMLLPWQPLVQPITAHHRGLTMGGISPQPILIWWFWFAECKLANPFLSGPFSFTSSGFHGSFPSGLTSPQTADMPVVTFYFPYNFFNGFWFHFC